MKAIGVEHVYIELLEECPVENAEQLRAVEGEYIRQLGTLNGRVEARTDQEYRNDTKEHKRDYDKEYVSKTQE